jgi:hypothetical protein
MYFSGLLFLGCIYVVSELCVTHSWPVTTGISRHALAQATCYEPAAQESGIILIASGALRRFS